MTVALELPDKMLIGGEWVDAAAGDRIEVENPSRREPLGSVPRGTAEDVDRAVKAAAKAFPEWRDRPSRERGVALLKIAEDLAAIGEELAQTIAAETGNAIRTQARGEATMTADIFRYYGGVASEQKGETLPLGEDMLSYTRREPLGVVAAIVPWNAPVMLASLKVAMALCTGNTLVLKAAEDAPLGVLRMAEIAAKHLPDGVLNVLTGYGEECGGALIEHPGIAKISFTGSTEVGRIAMRAAAERILPVSLELGGKAPAIVYPGLQRRRDGAARDRRDAVRAPGPVVHRRLAPVRAPGRVRRLHGQAVRRARRDGRRRRARRRLRHRLADLRHPGRARVRLPPGGARPGREAAGRRAARRRPDRLPAPADRAHRHRALLARDPRGGVRSRARRAARGTTRTR